MNLLKPNRKIFAVLVCLVLGLMLCGCTEKVEFSQEKIPVDVTELSMVLQPGETVLLDKLTVLQRLTSVAAKTTPRSWTGPPPTRR